VARVRLAGEEFALRGEDVERLKALAADLNGRLAKLAEELNLKSQPSKAALLVALNLLDELERVRADYERLQRGLSAAAASMLERIDSTLEPEEAALV